MALVFDALQVSNWQRAGKKAAKPHPLPRPKAPSTKKRMSLDDLRQWFSDYRKRLRARKRG